MIYWVKQFIEVIVCWITRVYLDKAIVEHEYDTPQGYSLYSKYRKWLESADNTSSSCNIEFISNS